MACDKINGLSIACKVDLTFNTIIVLFTHFYIILYNVYIQIYFF